MEASPRMKVRNSGDRKHHRDRWLEGLAHSIPDNHGSDLGGKTMPVKFIGGFCASSITIFGCIWFSNMDGRRREGGRSLHISPILNVQVSRKRGRKGEGRRRGQNAFSTSITFIKAIPAKERTLWGGGGGREHRGREGYAHFLQLYFFYHCLFEKHFLTFASTDSSHTRPSNSPPGGCRRPYHVSCIRIVIYRGPSHVDDLRHNLNSCLSYIIYILYTTVVMHSNRIKMQYVVLSALQLVVVSARVNGGGAKKDMLALLKGGMGYRFGIRV